MATEFSSRYSEYASGSQRERRRTPPRRNQRSQRNQSIDTELKLQDDSDTITIGDNSFRIELSLGRKGVVKVTATECTTKHAFSSSINGYDIGLHAVKGNRLIEFLKTAFFGESDDLKYIAGFVSGETQVSDIPEQRFGESVSQVYEQGSQMVVQIEMVHKWQSTMTSFAMAWVEMSELDRMEEMIKDLKRIVVAQQTTIDAQKRRIERVCSHPREHAFGRWTMNGAFSPLRWNVELDRPKQRIVTLTSNHSVVRFEKSGTYRCSLHFQCYPSTSITVAFTRKQGNKSIQLVSYSSSYESLTWSDVVSVDAGDSVTFQPGGSYTTAQGWGESYQCLTVEMLS